MLLNTFIMLLRILYYARYIGTIMLITLFIRRLARGLWPVSDLQPRISIATSYVNMEDEVQCVDFVELPIVQSQATSTTTSSTSILL